MLGVTSRRRHARTNFPARQRRNYDEHQSRFSSTSEVHQHSRDLLTPLSSISPQTSLSLHHSGPHQELHHTLHHSILPSIPCRRPACLPLASADAPSRASHRKDVLLARTDMSNVMRLDLSATTVVVWTVSAYREMVAQLIPEPKPVARMQLTHLSHLWVLSLRLLKLLDRVHLLLPTLRLPDLQV